MDSLGLDTFSFQFVLGYAVFFLLGGLFLGWILGHLHAEKVAARERAFEAEQMEAQKMWNEYINALKGGKNGK